MMSRTDWWRGAVIYQVYPRSFFDSNGDGVGDLPGITARLDYIASLGVDAIWVCPFYVSPMRDYGYDVADHRAVDPEYGTLADFDALVARAHALGLRVLIDQVWGHTSDRHAWFENSRRARNGAHADWYVWADPAPDGTPPNNWLSVFGGSAWTWEPRRRQYYLHHFLAEQPTLNLGNPTVMDAVLEIGEFWLERGVDGFRLDAVDFMAHDPLLRSNPAAPPHAETPAKLFGMQTHIRDMLQPETRGLLRRVRGLMDRYPGTTTLGEVSSQPGAFERVIDYTGDDHLHMAYTLRPLRGGFDWPTVRGMLAEAERARPDGWPCWSFSNHDVERVVSRWNPQRGKAPPDARFARLLITLLLSLRGSVTLYQGEELGLTEAELDRHALRDPFGIAYWPEFRGRDGSRTPMPWDASAPHGGFTTGESPWLPVPGAHRALAVSAQATEPTALLHDVRRFLAFRRGSAAMTHGDLCVLDLPEPLIGFVRSCRGERVLAIFNLSSGTVSTTLADYVQVQSLPESGYSAGMTADGVELGAYGAFFASVVPSQEWRATAALAFG